MYKIGNIFDLKFYKNYTNSVFVCFHYLTISFHWFPKFLFLNFSQLCLPISWIKLCTFSTLWSLIKKNCHSIFSLLRWRFLTPFDYLISDQSDMSLNEDNLKLSAPLFAVSQPIQHSNYCPWKDFYKHSPLLKLLLYSAIPY